MKWSRLQAFVLLIMITQGTPAADAPELTELRWMSGHWCGRTGDELIEEFWMAPEGGVLLGVARSLRDGRTTDFEYTRIVIESGVLVYIAQPHGGVAVAFRRTTGGDDWARFENPAHDFPTRVEYRRRGDALHAEIAGPGEDGKEVVIPFDYARCPD